LPCGEENAFNVASECWQTSSYNEAWGSLRKLCRTLSTSVYSYLGITKVILIQNGSTTVS